MPWGWPIGKLPPEQKRDFKTKLELGVEQLHWAKPLVVKDYAQRWVVGDGAYAKRPFLVPARQAGWVVVSRLRKDAALWDLPPTERRPGQRGPLPIIGEVATGGHGRGRCSRRSPASKGA